MSNLVIGILGGGQLGSMLSIAANKLQIKTVIYCDDKDGPGQYFANDYIVGEYTDKSKLDFFLDKVDLVTYEFENIPYDTLKFLSEKKKVLPDPKVNRIIQNRLIEKDFLNKCNIRTTNYVHVKDYKDLNSNINLLPGIIKTCTMGYDGKGQIKINSVKEIEKLNIDFKKEYILEKLVNLKKEVSVILTRFGHQKYEIYEPIENIHEDQILKFSKVPSDISNKIKDQCENWASIISEELDFIGTMCVEFFIDKNDNLYVNEIAPRVHNSGHLTIDAYNVSQFENHIRSICKLERIKIKKIKNAKMINLIGNEIEFYRNKKLNNNEFFYDYLKKEIKEKRKMGHLTITEK